jgi:beta-lactamase regulating signal transducer with metallopeptidase domain
VLHAAALAGLIAAAASLPLAACALLAARAYARALVRYRLLGTAFGLVAAVAPLALAAALLRPTAVAASQAAGAAGRLDALAAPLVSALALPLVAAAVAVAALLLLALAGDVVRVLRIKRRSAMFGTAPVRRARLGASSAVATPTAIGYLHPAVIVPAGFERRVDAGEWDAVLAHECAHLARGDDWAKALQSTLLRAGWWLPGLWLLGRALDLERELASDEWAARAGGARRYAACLLRLATDRRDRRGDVALALWGRRAHVAIRVERLLRPATGASGIARAAALGAFSATALAAVLGALVAVPGTRSSVPAPHPALALAKHRHVAPPLAARPARPAQQRPVAATVPAPAAAVPAPQRSAPRAPAAPRRVALVVPVPARPAAAPPAVKRSLAAAAPRRAHRPAAGRHAAAPRLLAYVPAPRRPCRTCLGPKTGAADGFGSSAFASPGASDTGAGGGSADLSRVPMLWIRLPSPAPNP